MKESSLLISRPVNIVAPRRRAVMIVYASRPEPGSGEDAGSLQPMDYTQITHPEQQDMLAAVGAGSVDELFGAIPTAFRFSGELDLPPAHVRRWWRS